MGASARVALAQSIGNRASVGPATRTPAAGMSTRCRPSHSGPRALRWRRVGAVAHSRRTTRGARRGERPYRPPLPRI